MKVSFYNENTHIFLVAFVRGTRFKFYTALRVPSEHWDKVQQRVKRRKTFPDYINYNRHLDHLQTLFSDKYFELMRTKEGPSIPALKDYMNQATFKKAKRRQKKLLEYWQELIDRRAKDPSFSPGTVKTYKTARNHFKAFCKVNGLHDWQDINVDFINKWKAYFYAQDLSVNYVEKMVQQLKVMLNQAVEEDLTDNMAFRKKAFIVKKSATDEKYLTLSELDKIATKHYNESLSKARDLFLLQSFTGVAYKDIPKINKGNISTIEGTRIISYYRGKTKVFAALPIHPIVERIMSANNWEPLKPFANQPYNRYLKDLCKIAEINDKVQKTNTRGGIEKVETFEKWELISTHTARRSFSTNFILSGGTKDQLKLMLGHGRKDITETYIKASMQRRAALLASLPFFNT